MQTNQQLREFWCQLERSQEAALLLDYDGTLAPFTVVRDQAFPYSGVPELLTAIQRDTGTRLVIISGRAIDDLVPLLKLNPLPEIWGCHGWELLDTKGKRNVFSIPEKASDGLMEAKQVLMEKGLHAACEVKPVSVALHWRGLDEERIKTLHHLVSDAWEPIAFKHQLEIHKFNGGIELRIPGQDKGTAVQSILETVDNSIPVAYLGDDLTDEDAFKAIAGRGLSILVSCENRQTQAQVKIMPPEGLINFLSTWLEKAPRQ